MKSNKAILPFGSKTIAYTLRYSDRKTLGITVTPEMEVIVTAPQAAAFDQIEAKLLKKAPWILKQLSYFLSFHPKTPTRQYLPGETHLYLGRQYLLQVVQARTSEVKLRAGKLEVHSPDTSPQQVKALVLAWYRQRAALKFNEVAMPLIQRFEKYGVVPTELRLQQMPTRWGSCTPKGKIILNPELIKAPRPCIEYVIVHELCHLIYRDHTARFIALQTREMPDWAKWKDKLERLLA